MKQNILQKGFNKILSILFRKILMKNRVMHLISNDYFNSNNILDNNNYIGGMHSFYRNNDILCLNYYKHYDIFFRPNPVEIIKSQIKQDIDSIKNTNTYKKTEKTLILFDKCIRKLAPYIAFYKFFN